MAWLTRITADEQVEYRLREQAGCSVVEVPAAETVVLEGARGEAVDHRLRTEGDAVLVWIGTGLSTVGLVDGAVLDEEGKDAARRLMNGCHPATGARLIRSRTSAAEAGQDDGVERAVGLPVTASVEPAALGFS